MIDTQKSTTFSINKHKDLYGTWAHIFDIIKEQSNLGCRKYLAGGLGEEQKDTAQQKSWGKVLGWPECSVLSLWETRGAAHIDLPFRFTERCPFFRLGIFFFHFSISMTVDSQYYTRFMYTEHWWGIHTTYAMIALHKQSTQHHTVITVLLIRCLKLYFTPCDYICGRWGPN